MRISCLPAASREYCSASARKICAHRIRQRLAAGDHAVDAADFPAMRADGGGRNGANSRSMLSSERPLTKASAPDNWRDRFSSARRNSRRHLHPVRRARQIQQGAVNIQKKGRVFTDRRHHPGFPSQLARTGKRNGLRSDGETHSTSTGSRTWNWILRPQPGKAAVCAVRLAPLRAPCKAAIFWKMFPGESAAFHARIIGNDRDIARQPEIDAGANCRRPDKDGRR